MSHVPADLRYTEEHEWVRTEADGTVTIGLTDHAQNTLGDIVFLDLPDVGRKAEAGDSIATVESVKAASDIYSPLTGEVVEVNQDAVESPEDVNNAPYETWLFKIKIAAGAPSDGLLDAKAYAKLVS
ncbi:glycine cleavage system protein GcvH [Streptomyces sp. NPDC058964]|uniref:glycine cleavage system protein GcvH n=1 Tax=Streptomyces sp. NPDC058964 TaxID=3346681 RepID=UPI0036A317D0